MEGMDVVGMDMVSMDVVGMDVVSMGVVCLFEKIYQYCKEFYLRTDLILEHFVLFIKASSWQKSFHQNFYDFVKMSHQR